MNAQGHTSLRLFAEVDGSFIGFDYVEACRVVIVLWLVWTLTTMTAQVGHWST